MPRRPGDFTEETKRVLAQRVAYCCSACGVITVGAQLDQDGPAIIGVAAHIAAASPDGARYDPTMTDDERKAQSNGIWLCQNCGRKIDVDWRAHTVEQLVAWRTEAERAANANIGKPRAMQDADRHRHINNLGLLLGFYIQLERRCRSERGSAEVEATALQTYNFVAQYLEREFDTALAFQFKNASSHLRPIGYPTDRGWLYGSIEGRKNFIDQLISRLRPW